MRYRILALTFLLAGFILSRPLTPTQIVYDTTEATVVVTSTQTIKSHIDITVYNRHNKHAKRKKRIIHIDTSQQVTSFCSGFIVSPKGYVATAGHCIADNNASVYLHSDNPGDKPRIAKVVVLSKALDVALLKIDVPKDTPYLDIDPNEQDPGARLYVVGHPQTFWFTATDGIVSRYVNIPYKKGALKFLQMSVPIDHGSSGAAVVNSKGKVVGIVSRYYFSTAPLNMAVPSDTLYALIHNIINGN